MSFICQFFHTTNVLPSSDLIPVQIVSEKLRTKLTVDHLDFSA